MYNVLIVKAKYNNLVAIFDIKPVDENGQVDVGRIEAVSARLDLRVKSRESGENNNQKPAVKAGFGRSSSVATSRSSTVDFILANTLSKSSVIVDNQKPRTGEIFDSVDPRGIEPRRPDCQGPARYQARPTVRQFYQLSHKKQNSAKELEKYLNSELDINKELKLVGAKIVDKPSIKYSMSSIKGDEYSDSQNFQFPIRQRADNFQSNFKSKIFKLDTNFFSQKTIFTVIVAGFVVFALMSLGKYGASVKSEVLKNSNTAVASLQEAKENLKTFDFVAASGNFEEAYKSFSEAGNDLNFLGASLTSFLVELPGFDKLTVGGTSKLKSARNIIEAGRLVAESGKAMSEAVTSLSQTNTIFSYNGQTIIYDGLTIISDLKQSLIASGGNLSKASALLLDVNVDVLPEEKKESFVEFQSKLPGFEKLVGDAIDYVDFIENFAGPGGIEKKYLVLFQNDSELRPTGGFPGTYGVMTFKNGQLTDFKVDDVYNLDGQLREKIIPPFPLQHITPTWGMRDANWFTDFSVSAKKITEFYEKITSRTCNLFTNPTCKEIDGVITLSPRMIADILKVVGPVELPEYGLTVDSDNFISAIQAEVEYGENREQPKRVVVDMAPLLMEKIYSANTSQWLEIFNVFVAGLERKDVMMYFDDFGLENFVSEKGFGGLVKDAKTDYLMVVISNIKGSKTDRVTSNQLRLNSKFEIRNSKSVVNHKLTITRQHNGGSDKFGFYNKQNPAFVRVLVPKGAELINISGNSKPNFKPLVDYKDGDFQEDVDLYNFESSFKLDGEKNVWTYGESGKKGFAFWMIIDPGKEKTVELEYSVLLANEGGRYNMYIQKQPGLDVKDFEFEIDGRSIYDGELIKDLEFKVKTK